MKWKNTIWLMLFYPIFASSAWIDKYAAKIQIVDDCTRLAEPFDLPALKVQKISKTKQAITNAIQACEQSRQRHPNDSHVAFLLAHVYTLVDWKNKGTEDHNTTRGNQIHLLAQQACSGGDMCGCTQLARHYVSYAAQHQQKDKNTFQLLSWDCARGNPVACRDLAGIMSQQKPYTRRDNRQIRSLLWESCRSGLVPDACVAYLDYRNILRTGKKSFRYEYAVYQGCAVGADSKACYLLQSYLRRYDSEHNESKITYAFGHACDQGNAEICNEISDPTTRLSCRSGNTKVCNQLARKYARKPHTYARNFLASEFYERSCQAGDMRFGCWYAGRYRLYRTPGVTKNIPVGIRYLERACYTEALNAFACYDLAWFHVYNSEKAYRNPAKAIQALQHGCRIGNARSKSFGCRLNIRECCDER